MSPNNPHSPDSKATPRNFATIIPQSLILQLGTVSLMGAVLVQKTLSETVVSLSQASEEIFRGDRLPILPFPDLNNATDNTTEIR